MKKLIVLAPVLALAFVFGCGGEPADETAEPAENTEPVAETVELSETIVLPEGWEMIDAVSVEEIEAIVGADGYDTWHEPLSDAAGGKPQLSYFDTTREGESRPGSKINFLVYTFDGGSNYDRVLGYITDTEEVESDLWERAVVGTMDSLTDDPSVGMLIQRGDVCIRIKWNPAEYPEMDRVDFSVELAELIINNLYGG